MTTYRFAKLAELLEAEAAAVEAYKKADDDRTRAAEAAEAAWNAKCAASSAVAREINALRNGAGDCF